MVKPKIKVSCGFAFNPEMTHVVLILKNRPEAIKGLWNGAGGKVDEGETSVEAQAREMGEETGVSFPTHQWKYLRTVEPKDSKFSAIDCFFAVGDILGATTKTDEQVAIFEVKNLPQNMVEDARESIKMILEMSSIYRQGIAYSIQIY